MAEIIEEEQFKAKLKYDITRASSSPVSKQCPYNKHQRVYRYCLDNFPNISEWGKVNFTQCKNKLGATTKLKILNGVSTDMAKHKLRVRRCKLGVTSYELKA